MAEVTLAHELEHALADQRLTLPELNLSPAQSDRALARRALVEGDATLTMQKYALSTLDNDDRAALASDPSTERASVQMEKVPHFLRRALMFPYFEGAVFVSHLYRTGGWAAINEAYRHPPRSSAEVLFPGRYGDFRPRMARVPQFGGGEWSGHETQSLGGAELMWMVEAPTGAQLANPGDAAEWGQGWTGGRIDLWTSGDDLALAMTLTDNLDAGNEFTLCEVLERWYRTAFQDARELPDPAGATVLEGEASTAALTCSGVTVRLGIAPDRDTALDLIR